MTTSQVHVAFQHIVEFLEMKNSSSDNPVGKSPLFFEVFLFVLLGLGFYSEQAFESMHHDAKVVYNLYFSNIK